MGYCFIGTEKKNDFTVRGGPGSVKIIYVPAIRKMVKRAYSVTPVHNTKCTCTVYHPGLCFPFIHYSVDPVNPL